MKENKHTNKIPWDYILIAIIVIGTITGVAMSTNNKPCEKEVTPLRTIPGICFFKCANLNLTYFAENPQKDFCLCLTNNSTVVPIQRSGSLQ